MLDGFTQLGFIGPGGPEIMVVMLVLLMMFGAKDAPRILRKLNEIINQIRNTADGFKREIMYGDINASKPTFTPSDHDHNESHEYGDDYSYGDDFNEEVFQKAEESLAGIPPEPESEASDNKDDDAGKA